jgi:hypothetical protein
VTVTELTSAGTVNVCSLPVEENTQVVVLPLVVQVGSALASVVGASNGWLFSRRGAVSGAAVVEQASQHQVSGSSIS